MFEGTDLGDLARDLREAVQAGGFGGLPLPEMRTGGREGGGREEEERGREGEGELEMTALAGPAQAGPAQAGQAGSAGLPTGLTPEVLAMMPPEIRAIALRRPELLSQAAAASASSAAAASLPLPPPSPYSPPSVKPLGMSEVKQAMMRKPSYASRFLGARLALNPDGEEDQEREDGEGCGSEGSGEEGDEANLLGL